MIKGRDLRHAMANWILAIGTIIFLTGSFSLVLHLIRSFPMPLPG